MPQRNDILIGCVESGGAPSGSDTRPEGLPGGSK